MTNPTAGPNGSSDSDNSSNAKTVVRKANSLLIGAGPLLDQEQELADLTALTTDSHNLPVVGPTLAEHFAKHQLTQSTAHETPISSSEGQQKQGLQQQPQQQRSGTRSLVGGTFILPHTCNDDDVVSLDSTSLFGAFYAPSDQSVATRVSLLEYSEDERSERDEGTLRTSRTNVLGRDATSTYGTTSPGRGSLSPGGPDYLLDRESDDTISILSSEQASFLTDDEDGYFTRHPIMPKSLLGGGPYQYRDLDDPSSSSSTDQYRSSSFDYGTDAEDHHYILDSTDTDHVYEDDDETSSNYLTDEPLFEDDDSTSDESWNRTHKEEQPEPVQTATKTPPPPSDLNWSAYNQERGRYLAQRLISKARLQPSEIFPPTPSTIASMDVTDTNDYDDESDDDNFMKGMRMILNPFVYRRRRRRRHDATTRRVLDQEYRIVDATVKEEEDAAAAAAAAAGIVVDGAEPNERHGSSEPISNKHDAKELSPNSSIRSSHGADSSSSSPSESILDDDDDDNNDDGVVDSYDDDQNVIQDLTESSALPYRSSPALPDGLLRRAASEDIVSQLNLGSEGWSALQQLREVWHDTSQSLSRLPLGQSDPDPSTAPPPKGTRNEDMDELVFSVQGIELRNYQLQVHRSVVQYRRHVLEVSDEVYYSESSNDAVMMNDGWIDMDNSCTTPSPMVF